MSRAAAIETDIGIPLVITTIQARPVAGEPGKWEFDKNIVGERNDADALFLKDVTKREVDGVMVYTGTAVSNMGAEIDAVAKKRGASHCLLCVHGYTNTPGSVFDLVRTMNQHYEGTKAFALPVVWPAERVDYFGQKQDAPGAAKGLRSLVPGVMSATTPISVLCHSMGNYVLNKFPPHEDEDVRFQFDNIFMVAADVRATTFDVGDSEKAGPGILRICKKKVHVLWHWWDMALLGRRLLNCGRIALGKVGKQYSEEKLVGDGAQLIFRECADFNKELEGAAYWTGHGYHVTPGALDYYLENL